MYRRVVAQGWSQTIVLAYSEPGDWDHAASNPTHRLLFRLQAVFLG